MKDFEKYSFCLLLHMTIAYNVPVIEIGNDTISRTIHKLMAIHCRDAYNIIDIQGNNTKLLSDILRHHEFYIPKLIIKNGTFIKWEKKIQELIIFLDDLNIFDQLMRRWTTYRLWNSNARFYIITEMTSTTISQQVCSLMQEYKVARAVLAHIIKADIKLYKCDLFQNRVISLDETDLTNVRAFENILQLHGYPVKIIGPKDENLTVFYKSLYIEKLYMNVIINKLNASITMVPQIEVNINLLKQFSQQSDLLLTFKFKLTDILFVSTFMDTNNSYYQHTYPHTDSRVVLIVPKSGVMSRLKLLLQPQHHSTWLMSLGGIIASGVIWLYIRRRRKRLVGADIFSVVSLSILLRNDLRTFYDKCFFMYIAVLGIVMKHTFQGSMNFIFTITVYEPDINDMDTLVKSNLNITIPIEVFRRITHGNMEDDQDQSAGLYSKYIPRDMYEVWHKLEMNDNSEAYVISRDYAEHLQKEQEHKSPTGDSYFHRMKINILPIHESFAVIYGAPYLDRFNQLILQIKSAGLDVHWNSMSFVEENLQRLDGQRALQLSMEQSTIVFSVLLIGLKLSTLVFVGEIIYFHRTKMYTFFGGNNRQAF